MPTSPLPTRVTSLLLAMLVTGSVLGSMNLIAAGQVDLARSTLQQTSPSNPHLAGQVAGAAGAVNCVRG